MAEGYNRAEITLYTYCTTTVRVLKVRVLYLRTKVPSNSTKIDTVGLHVHVYTYSIFVLFFPFFYESTKVRKYEPTKVSIVPSLVLSEVFRTLRCRAINNVYASRALLFGFGIPREFPRHSHLFPHIVICT